MTDTQTRHYDSKGSLIGIGSTHRTTHRLTDDERMEIIDRLDAGETANSIALEVGVSSRTVHRLRDALGMTVHKNSLSRN